ncbi:DUF952 domain-containing protein [Streptomyces indicus]|uniref:Uncharacterized conserved protein, DUF952 family n=1 Tax=Streptomyces indicus TaxID=417292 RepID=A0A1G9I843_9ACTN|nr:DUF952 domain-containing protein [Streptomyces indicus]SDL21440.1 Uncharacterized conserved protein, DUF952 family [Streptomyces indicus]
MTEIVHLTERTLWDEAVRAGVYAQSTRGRTLAEEGFVHCSTWEQLPDVASFLYPDADAPGRRALELVLLVIESERLSVPVRYEAAAPGGPEFPHIYGPVPTEAVVRVESWPPPGCLGLRPSEPPSTDR